MRRLLLGSIVFATSVLALVPSCSSSESEGDTPFDPGSGDGGDSGADGTTGDGTVGDGTVGDDTGGGIAFDTSTESGTCAKGSPCGDGGTCVGGTCCEGARACGDACCASAQICSFQKCVTPGSVCNDSADCGTNEYCEYSLGPATPVESDAGAPDAGGDGGTCVGGVALKEGRCVPRPPTCSGGDAGPADGGALTCLESCQYKPAPGTFSPTAKYSWINGQSPYDRDVMMTPIVLQLDDDDCDGKITARDIPEIIFTTFSGGDYHNNGVLHALSVVKGAIVEKWTKAGVHPTRQIAGGNIDGLPGNEVVVCFGNGTGDVVVKALRGDGSELWTTGATKCFMPAIADLDGDGDVEVIVEGGILDGKTGTLEYSFAEPLKGPASISDIDGDGKLDIVTGPQAFKWDGSLIVDTHIGETSYLPNGPDWKFPGSAIGDFDKDGKPEIVVMHNLDRKIWVWRYDATKTEKFTTLRTGIDINGALTPCGAGWGATHGGGPPTIADFNGDGYPDVALAGAVGYAVFDGKKLIDPAVLDANTFLWLKPTTDCSSASTGSTVFDFDGDGKAEVAYSDETKFRIYEGATGNVLFETCNTTATLIENPVVADVDNDGQADIVVVSNAYARACEDDATVRYGGIRIFGDANGRWVRTRRVWNQHAYNVTNVEEDGTIPTNQPVNWTTPGLNNFRQNKQPGGEFAAPDVVVSVEPRCPGPFALLVTVRNLGESSIPPGVDVVVQKGTSGVGTTIASVKTTLTLYPAEAETIVVPLGAGDADVKDGTASVWATVTPPASVKECRPDNNTSPPIKALCTGPK